MLAIYFAARLMVCILDGISKLGAHVRSNLCHLTCIRLLISSRVSTNRVYLPEKTYFHHLCATFNELPSHISTMVHSTLVCVNTAKNDMEGEAG